MNELLRAKSERRLTLKCIGVSGEKMSKKNELPLPYVKKLELMCVWNFSCFTWSIYWRRRRQEWKFYSFYWAVHLKVGTIENKNILHSSGLDLSKQRQNGTRLCFWMGLTNNYAGKLLLVHWRAWNFNHLLLIP